MPGLMNTNCTDLIPFKKSNWENLNINSYVIPDCNNGCSDRPPLYAENCFIYNICAPSNVIVEVVLLSSAKDPLPLEGNGVGDVLPLPDCAASVSPSCKGAATMYDHICGGVGDAVVFFNGGKCPISLRIKPCTCDRINGGIRGDSLCTVIHPCKGIHFHMGTRCEWLAFIQ